MVNERITGGQGVPDAVGEARRPARAGGRRPLGVAARVHRLGAGVARAGREDADAPRMPDRRPLRVHRVVVDDRYRTRRSGGGAAAHGRAAARRRRDGARRRGRRRGAAGRDRRSSACARAARCAATGTTRSARPRRCRADGWIQTGDLGFFRADGNLVLCGRITEMYIRGGYNVYPLEVENVLAEHPGVDRVAVRRRARAGDRRDRRRLRGRPRPRVAAVGRRAAGVVPAIASPTTRRPTASSSSTRCPSRP